MPAKPMSSRKRNRVASDRRVNFKETARVIGHRPLIEVVEALHFQRFPKRQGFNTFKDCSLAAAGLRGGLIAGRIQAVTVASSGRPKKIRSTAWRDDSLWEEMLRDYGATSPRYFISELHAAQTISPPNLQRDKFLKLPSEAQLLLETYIALDVPQDFPISRTDIEVAMRHRLPRTPTITKNKLITFLRLLRSSDRPYGGRIKQVFPPHIVKWRTKHVV